MSNKDWRTPTTFVQRFGDALELLCNGKRPSDDLIRWWLDKDVDNIDLQEFCVENGPSWAQGIRVIDAAHTLAENPVEGVNHETA